MFNAPYLLIVLCLLAQIVFAQKPLETSGERRFYDSANYSIIRGNYVSGQKYLECYENRITKLDSWKLFYKNGQVKEEGLMTNSSHIYVGVWKYYSKSGKIDSIVDYDKKQPISYFNALKVAESSGFTLANSTVDRCTYKQKEYWQIVRWTEKADHSGTSAEILLIDINTGEIIRPKDLKITTVN
jgi:hypothetical protein